MTTSTFTTTHVRVQTARSFAEVTKSLEQQLGKFDSAVFQLPQSSPDRAPEVRSRIEAMAGPSGLMVFGTTDHGRLLGLSGAGRGAIQYLVGNPLAALQMTRRDIGAGLYAPLRVLIYESDGNVVLEYDRPSSLFAQFDDPEINAVASTLDRKLELLVEAAVG